MDSHNTHSLTISWTFDVHSYETDPCQHTGGVEIGLAAMQGALGGAESWI
jgi:hypothetical protein